MKIRQKLRANARRLAPRHPPGPESRMRLAIARLFVAYHKNIIKVMLEHEKRMDASSLRLHSWLGSARSHGSHLLRQSGIRNLSSNVAQKTAKSVSSHISKVSKVKDLNPNTVIQSYSYSSRIIKGIEDRMNESIEAAEFEFDVWSDEDPDERGDLEDSLEDVLDGQLGSAIGWSAMVFGLMFADMNKEVQNEAGIEKYVWITQHDARVRFSHNELDFGVFDWDDPPLKAEVSDNEEDDHPGEDFGCRCVASPVVGETVESG